jgi:hypothetical protein
MSLIFQMVVKNSLTYWDYVPQPFLPLIQPPKKTLLLYMKEMLNLPAPATTIFCFGKSIIGLPCALTAPKRPAIATPAVPCKVI